MYKIKITLTDDDGKEFSGEVELNAKVSQGGKTKTIKSQVSKSENKYKGVSGGIEFLIDKGFFGNPKSKKEVLDELKKEGYFHSSQTVDSALRHTFVNSRKILTRIKEKDVWKYVLRK